MKKIFLFFFVAMVLVATMNNVYSQTVYQFPEKGIPILKVTIPYGWKVSYLNDPGRPANDHGEVAFVPNDASTGPFVAITRAALDPDSPNATADIINGCKGFCTLLFRTRWQAKIGNGCNDNSSFNG